MHNLLLALVPLVGILYPLWVGIPNLYRWQMRRRVYRYYGELKWIERQLHETSDEQKRGELFRQLDELEERVFKMRVPNAYSSMGYNFRLHIQTLRASKIVVAPGQAGESV